MDETDGNEVKATAADRSALIPVEPPAETLEVDQERPVEQVTEDAEKTEYTEEISEINETAILEETKPEGQPTELENQQETNDASVDIDDEEVDDVVAGAPDQTPDSSDLLIEESLEPTGAS